MPWDPKILRLGAQDQLARTVLCQLPSSSARSSPDLSPGSHLLPRLPLMAASRDADKLYSFSLILREAVGQPVAKCQAASLSSELAGEGVIKHPRWPQGLGEVICGGSMSCLYFF